jgi:hypothetical protein
MWQTKKDFKNHVQSVMRNMNEYWGHKHQLLIKDDPMSEMIYHVGDLENVSFSSFPSFDAALDFFIKCEDIRFSR